MTGAAAAPSRQAKRRERTRAQLVAAARALFARKGVEETRINEITEEADVGFGSFYNHFDSKEAIVEAVLEETLTAQGTAIEEVTRDLEDPAEVVAVAHRHFVKLARAEPDWAWLFVRLEASHNVMVAALGPYARHDLERGVHEGRFSVPSSEIAFFAMGGALLFVMRAVLDGNAKPDADSDHAEGILRMLGLAPADAAEVARRPMPAIAVPL